MRIPKIERDRLDRLIEMESSVKKKFSVVSCCRRRRRRQKKRTHGAKPWNFLQFFGQTRRQHDGGDDGAEQQEDSVHDTGRCRILTSGPVVAAATHGRGGEAACH